MEAIIKTLGADPAFGLDEEQVNSLVSVFSSVFSVDPASICRPQMLDTTSTENANATAVFSVLAALCGGTDDRVGIAFLAGGAEAVRAVSDALWGAQEAFPFARRTPGLINRKMDKDVLAHIAILRTDADRVLVLISSDAPNFIWRFSGALADEEQWTGWSGTWETERGEGASAGGTLSLADVDVLHFEEERKLDDLKNALLMEESVAFDKKAEPPEGMAFREVRTSHPVSAMSRHGAWWPGGPTRPADGSAVPDPPRMGYFCTSITTKYDPACTYHDILRKSGEEITPEMERSRENRLRIMKNRNGPNAVLPEDRMCTIRAAFVPCERPEDTPGGIDMLVTHILPGECVLANAISAPLVLPETGNRSLQTYGAVISCYDPRRATFSLFGLRLRKASEPPGRHDLMSVHPHVTLEPLIVSCAGRPFEMNFDSSNNMLFLGMDGCARHLQSLYWTCLSHGARSMQTLQQESIERQVAVDYTRSCAFALRPPAKDACPMPEEDIEAMSRATATITAAAKARSMLVQMCGNLESAVFISALELVSGRLCDEEDAIWSGCVATRILTRLTKHEREVLGVEYHPFTLAFLDTYFTQVLGFCDALQHLVASLYDLERVGKSVREKQHTVHTEEEEEHGEKESSPETLAARTRAHAAWEGVRDALPEVDAFFREIDASGLAPGMQDTRQVIERLAEVLRSEEVQHAVVDIYASCAVLGQDSAVRVARISRVLEGMGYSHSAMMRLSDTALDELAGFISEFFRVHHWHPERVRASIEERALPHMDVIAASIIAPGLVAAAKSADGDFLGAFEALREEHDFTEEKVNVFWRRAVLGLQTSGADPSFLERANALECALPSGSSTSITTLLHFLVDPENRMLVQEDQLQTPRILKIVRSRLCRLSKVDMHCLMRSIVGGHMWALRPIPAVRTPYGHSLARTSVFPLDLRFTSEKMHDRNVMTMNSIARSLIEQEEEEGGAGGSEDVLARHVVNPLCYFYIAHHVTELGESAMTAIGIGSQVSPDAFGDTLESVPPAVVSMPLLRDRLPRSEHGEIGAMFSTVATVPARPVVQGECPPGLVAKLDDVSCGIFPEGTVEVPVCAAFDESVAHVMGTNIPVALEDGSCTYFPFKHIVGASALVGLSFVHNCQETWFVACTLMGRIVCAPIDPSDGRVIEFPAPGSDLREWMSSAANAPGTHPEVLRAESIRDPDPNIVSQSITANAMRALSPSTTAVLSAMGGFTLIGFTSSAHAGRAESGAPAEDGAPSTDP